MSVQTLLDQMLNLLGHSTRMPFHVCSHITSVGKLSMNSTV